MELATLSAPSKVNLTAMTAAIVGILLQIAAGVDYPTVPPGPIILAVAVGLVVFARRRWALVVAAVVPVFLTVGGTIAFLVNDEMALRHPDDLGAFLATVLQMVAVVVGAAAGVQALRRDPT